MKGNLPKPESDKGNLPKAIEACAAVIQKNDKFLITKRLAASPMGHCWEFPGGKLEPGETVEEAVVREVREEVGLGVRSERKLQDLFYDYPHGLIHLTFVLCSIVSGEPQTLECSDFRWIEPHEFSQFEFPPADVGVIEALIRGTI